MTTATPIIEILGPWLQNNGDGLNLWSVANRFSGSATLAVSSMLGMERLPDEPRLCWIKWSLDSATENGNGSSASLREALKARRDKLALALVPRGLLERRGIVRGGELTALLDCSGFAYGDAWSTRRTKEREAYFRRLKEQGTLIILLPQAFGPFERPAVRSWCSKLLEHCDLIFARDRVSQQHLEDLGLTDKLGGVTPDITHLLPGKTPDDPEAWGRRVCIVPNARMTDRTSPETAQRYQDFLLQSIRLVRERGLEPWLVVHEKNDYPLAQQIRESDPQSPPIISEDALTSKGILGACYALIGSRYHALISALSQGVPAIGTSWSHKYEELFDDYGCREYLLLPADDPDKLQGTIRQFLDPATRSTRAAGLAGRADQQKARVERMWGQIESLIRSRTPSSPVRGTRRPSLILGRLKDRLSEASVRRGVHPARFRYRYVARENLPSYVARKSGEPGGPLMEIIHREQVAQNPLPCNVSDRDELPDDRGWWSFSFWDVPARTSSQTILATVPECRVVWYRDPQRGNDFYPAILSREGISLEFREVRFRGPHAEVLRRAGPPARISKATWILERVYHNHSHWLTAHLPKILLLRQRNQLADLLLPPDRTAAMDGSLRMLGLRPEDFPTFDSSRPLEVEELTILATDRFRPELLRMVPEAFGVLDAPPPHRKVFISRAKATRRRLINEDQAWALLEPEGFERVCMEELNFQQQVELMRQTAVLCAPHGAGLTNMMFCPPGAHVLEIADVGFPNPNFYALASALGHRYWLLPANSLGDCHPLEKDLQIDPSLLGSLLSRLK